MEGEDTRSTILMIEKTRQCYIFCQILEYIIRILDDSLCGRLNKLLGPLACGGRIKRLPGD